MRAEPGKVYCDLTKVSGALVFLAGVRGVGFGEMVEITGADGRERLGRVLVASEQVVAVEVYEGTGGLSAARTRARFLGRPLEVPVSHEMLGRALDSFARPLDGGPPPLAQEWRGADGAAINPAVRAYPQEFLQTGISAIDGMNTLVRGQKLPIFSASGLPHNQLAAQIVRQSQVPTDPEAFVVVFAIMGASRDVAEMFRRSVEESGTVDRVAMFLNFADDPAVERLVTPRTALTLAEYLAFDEGLHVLVVLTDMTQYSEALREVASAKGEVPSRKGFPGYLYSDLASIYERAGSIQGKRGSVTQVPILTMPNDDITHPIPDLTGYITEGQIVVERELDRRGIYPPINVLPSLSRLMADGIGAGHTREDHAHLSNQLYSAYAYTRRIRMLATIIGEEELSGRDKMYLEFGRRFETEFVGQSATENRTIEETLDRGWRILKAIPPADLTRVTEEEIAEHLR
ncbi:MAG TPA: V-type ATP synthase subunit B [Candidatus Binataceae bacterium]|nr:V-type ATP synthase subunit B [Candidatus Binataceae bacterium]